MTVGSASQRLATKKLVAHWSSQLSYMSHLSHSHPPSLMEAKLKSLKVVDLKQILASAKVSTPAKATKGDLIARILANKDALDAYAKQYPQDDLLAPPEECVLVKIQMNHLY